MTTVKLGNIDITGFVDELPRLTDQASDYGQLLLQELPSIVGDNTRGFWDRLNPASPFFHADLNSFYLTVEQDGFQVWSGFILGIRASYSNKTATITLKSEIQTILDGGLVYISGVTDADAAQTPSEIVRSICVQYDIPYDSESFARANQIYAADNVLIRVNAPLPTLKIADAFTQIAQIGLAKIYQSRGKLCFQTWDNTTYARTLAIFTDQSTIFQPIITLIPAPPTRARLMNDPEIEPIEKQKINGYSIQWVGRTETFGSTDNAFSLSNGPDNPIQIHSAQAAVWIGERYMKYSSWAQDRVTAEIPTRIAASLRLGYPITIEYDAAHWATGGINCELTSIDAADKVSAIIAGVTI